MAVAAPAALVGSDESASDSSLPPRKDAYYSLMCVTVVVMFTVLDRTILSLLIDPIKKDFALSDTQAALLLGAAFSLPYGITAILVGRVADHQRHGRHVYE